MLVEGLCGNEPFVDEKISDLSDEEVKADGLISHLYGGDCDCPTMPIW